MTLPTALHIDLLFLYTKTEREPIPVQTQNKQKNHRVCSFKCSKTESNVLVLIYAVLYVMCYYN